MRNEYCLLLFGLGVSLTVPNDLCGQSHRELLARAEKQFQLGVESRSYPKQSQAHFKKAAKAYWKLYQSDVRNPELLLNLGKAEILADRLPQAILAWRLGTELAPGDARLKKQLEWARNQVNYSPIAQARPETTEWPPWLLWPTAPRLLLVCLFVYVFSLMALTRWVMKRKSSHFVFGIVSVSVVLALLTASLLVQEANQRRLGTPVVVIVEKTIVVRLGNGDSYPEVPGLPKAYRGMEAKLLFERSGWLQVEFPNEEVGWVRKGDVIIGVLSP
ncbi:MAG: hypothetical protein ACFCD0_30005 [Gemmataceae bacterium]